MTDSDTLAKGYMELFSSAPLNAMKALCGAACIESLFIGGSRRFLNEGLVPETSDIDVFVLVSSLSATDIRLRDHGFYGDLRSTEEYDSNVVGRRVLTHPDTGQPMIDVHLFTSKEAYLALEFQHNVVDKWAKETTEGQDFIQLMEILTLNAMKPAGSGKHFFRHMLARAARHNSIGG